MVTCGTPKAVIGHIADAVYVYNLAQILKIYLNDITNVEELNIFRSEISKAVTAYTEQYDKMIKWANKYLDETNSLNKMSIIQMLLTAGSGVFAGILSRSLIVGGQLVSEVSNILEEDRKKKKEAHVARNDEYQTQMNNMELIYSSIAVMDKYIELVGKKAEIVSVEGAYYIRYIDGK